MKNCNINNLYVFPFLIKTILFSNPYLFYLLQNVATVIAEVIKDIK